MIREKENIPKPFVPSNKLKARRVWRRWHTFEIKFLVSIGEMVQVIWRSLGTNGQKKDKFDV